MMRCSPCPTLLPVVAALLGAGCTVDTYEARGLRPDDSEIRVSHTTTGEGEPEMLVIEFEHPEAGAWTVSAAGRFDAWQVARVMPDGSLEEVPLTHLERQRIPSETLADDGEEGPHDG